MQHEHIARRRQDRQHRGDGKHNDVTKNSVQRPENVGRNERKSERGTPVIREEVKLDGKRGEHSTISFLKYRLPANSIHKRHFQYNGGSI